MPHFPLSNALKQNPMFANLDEYSFQIIESYLSFKALDVGEVLFEEGERGDFMAIVVAGKLDILKKTSSTVHAAYAPDDPLSLGSKGKALIVATETIVGQAAQVGLQVQLELANKTQQNHSKGMTRLSTLKTGDSLGEMAMIDELPRSATVRAIERSGLILLPNKDFERILQDHPRIGIEMLKGIARKLSINLRRTSDVLSQKSIP